MADYDVWQISICIAVGMIWERTSTLSIRWWGDAVIKLHSFRGKSFNISLKVPHKSIGPANGDDETMGGFSFFQVICHGDEEIWYGRRWYTIKLFNMGPGRAAFLFHHVGLGMFGLQSFCGLGKCWTLHFSNFQRGALQASINRASLESVSRQQAWRNDSERQQRNKNEASKEQNCICIIDAICIIERICSSAKAIPECRM
jgi:hypothetical protein